MKTLAWVVPVILAGCFGFGGKGDWADDYFHVEFVTSYFQKGLANEPAAGSPCRFPCEIWFSSGPLNRPTGTTGSGRSATGGNGSEYDQEKGEQCTLPPGKGFIQLGLGDRLDSRGCSYHIRPGGDGKIDFWVPKRPTVFLAITEITGRVQEKVSGCRDATYGSRIGMTDGHYQEMLPEFAVNQDKAVTLEFTIQCFEG